MTALLMILAALAVVAALMTVLWAIHLGLRNAARGRGLVVRRPPRERPAHELEAPDFPLAGSAPAASAKRRAEAPSSSCAASSRHVDELSRSPIEKR